LFNAQGKLTRIEAPSGEFVSLQYNEQGHLLWVTDPQGRKLQLNYPAQAGVGPNLFQGVMSIDTPVGRYSYSYGDGQDGATLAPKKKKGAKRTRYGLTEFEEGGGAPSPPAGERTHNRKRLSNLVHVGWPDGFGRSYHYEDERHPNLLTGITQHGEGGVEQRLSSYAYDANGYAIESSPLAGDRVRFGERVPPRPNQPGRTVLEDSAGRKTTYTHTRIAGERRVLESRGAGCPSCAPANMRYRYNEQGQELEGTRLDKDGRPVSGVRRGYDTWGRMVRVERLSYPAKGAPSSAPAVQLLMRYEYEEPVKTPEGPLIAFDRPSLIVRPSVVEGQEHRIEIAYNARGQVTRITETGYRPALPLPEGTPEPGLIKTSTAQAKPHNQPERIERTTTYRYTEFSGRSLIAEIDGPLPNGPKGTPEDSDITLYHWDSEGRFVERITRPGGSDTRTFERNQIGQVVRVTSETPANATNLTYDRNGAILSALSDDGFGVAYEYDLFGRRVSTFALEPGRRIPRNHRTFDAAGRLIAEVDAAGRIKEAVYDDKGQLVASRVSGVGFKQEERYEYDEHGRLIGVSDNTGATRRILRDATGQPTGFVDPLGRTARIGYDDRARVRFVEQGEADADRLRVDYHYSVQGHLTAVLQQGTALGQAVRRETRFVFDDFDRRIGEFSAEAGAIVHLYDLANRLVAERRANGDWSQYRYDVSGKPIHIAHWAAVQSGNPATEIHYKYQGGRLAEVLHPEERETYGYDAKGRLTERTVQLKLNNGQWKSYPTRYRYDGSGRLIGRSLPDGKEALFERDTSGQIVAFKRRLDGGWFGWWPKEQTLARDLSRSVGGLDRIVYGNGVVGNWERSLEGVLARIHYSNQPTKWDGIRQFFADVFGAVSGEAHAAQDAQPVRGEPIAPPGAWADAHLPKTLHEERFVYDAASNIVATRRIEAGERLQDRFYGYDGFDQLLVAAQSQGEDGGKNAKFYYHDPLGDRRLDRETDVHTRSYGYNAAGQLAGKEPDALGRATRLDDKRLVWDAQGHLSAVEVAGQTVARYRYNHRHERIAKQTGEGTTHYLYENRQRVAELDEAGRVVRQYLWLGERLIAVIDAAKGKGKEKTTTIHTNHLEAPILATNESGRPVWRAEYAPFGALRELSDPAGLNLELRNPGQWSDAESGLYYNDRRYYDPESGRYVSPDPLGLAGGGNRYAYVGANPLRWVDLLGLVLFAFDGTLNDRTNPNTLTNVVNFLEAYDDGRKYYISGPGTNDEEAGIILNALGKAGDAMIAFTGLERVAAMEKYLMDEIKTTNDPNKAIDIDIVGFSRGAAQAREFANLIAGSVRGGFYSYTDADGNARCQRVNLRFMGLFDTVLSTAKDAGDYRLGIPPEFAYVAHAVALNEHRAGPVAFPLESIVGSPASDGTRIEMGFLGSHSDIGGGFKEGDLAKVALVWMVNQAEAAGVKIKQAEVPKTIIANPVIHDKSDNQRTPAIMGDGRPNPDFGLFEDRQVRYMDGSRTKQIQMTGTGMTTADTYPFIRYDSPGLEHLPGHGMVRRVGPDFRTGTVDMAAYLKWLNDNGYNINLTVTPSP
jgi:RHS repeat-associated protein